ncbi:hypothetical protein, partial [Tepidiforma sp.]|uniref:hypothetical protein n=1 Tax=Tepidiforma sp. TaxID=2682230 RepID=UPI002ADE4F96
MLRRRIARHLPLAIAAFGALLVVLAHDARAQTATRTIRVEKVIVDNFGIAPPATFTGQITNAGDGTWSVTSSNRTQDFTVPTNLVHTVTESAPPAWTGWTLGGYKQVSPQSVACGTSGFTFTTASNSVAPGTGSPKICVRNTFTGGVLHIGVVPAPGASGAPPTVAGTVVQVGSALTSWQATAGGFAQPIGLAAGSYGLSVPALPEGWSVVGWAAGSHTTAPTCPASPSAYGATASTVTITAGQRTVACLMVDFTPPPPATATLFVGAVRDSSPGVPPDDGLVYGGDVRDSAGTRADRWGPVGFGSFHQLELQPGAFAVGADGSGGWLPNGVANGSFAGGSPACPGEAAAYAPWDAAGAPVDLAAGTTAVVCLRFARLAAFPAIAMSKHPGGPAGGLARWQLTVSNAEALDLPVELRTDATTFVAAAGGSCPDADLADGVLTCTVPARGTLVVTVAAPLPAPACNERTLNATASAFLLPPARAAATPFGGSLGGTASTAYTVPADPAACPVTVTIHAAFAGGPPPGEGSYPAFAFDPSPSPTADLCGAPDTPPGALRWTCTLPPGWAGIVSATAPAGWEACDPVDADPPADFVFRFCRRVSFEVRVVVTNGEAGAARFGFVLTPFAQGGALEPLRGEAGVATPAHLSDVPLAAAYLVDAADRFGFRRLGLGYPGDGGVCQAAPSLPASALPATLSAVPPGEQRVICLYYERVTPVVVEKVADPPVVRPGGAFRWIVEVAIVGAALPAGLQLADPIGLGLPPGPLEGELARWCLRQGDEIECEIPEGTAPGRYRLAIPVAVPAEDFAVCGEHRNTVRFAGPGVDAGSEDATVSVDCPAAATLHVRGIVADGTGAAGRFSATVHGPGLAPDGEPLAFSAIGIAELPGLPAGTFTLAAVAPPGYAYLGWALGTIDAGGPGCPANPAHGGATLAAATLTPASPEAVFCLYAEPRVTVRVINVLNILGFERPGPGWEFTIEGCGIAPQRGTTDGAGVVAFADLPPATGCSYTVAGTAQPSWEPTQAIQVVRPTDPARPAELRFVNIRRVDVPCAAPGDPRCAPPPAPTDGAAPAPPAPVEIPAATPTP